MYISNRKNGLSRDLDVDEKEYRISFLKMLTPPQYIFNLNLDLITKKIVFSNQDFDLTSTKRIRDLLGRRSFSKKRIWDRSLHLDSDKKKYGILLNPDLIRRRNYGFGQEPCLKIT